MELQLINPTDPKTTDPKIVLSAIPLGQPKSMPPKTRIVCTIAPLNNRSKPAGDEPADGVRTEERIGQLVRAGMSIVRINFSHVNSEQRKENVLTLIKAVRETSRKTMRPIGIMMDLRGPRPRIGKVKQRTNPETGKAESIVLEAGKKYVLTTVDEHMEADEEKCFVQYEGEDFASDIQHNLDQNHDVCIFINDGKIRLKAIKTDKSDVICEIVIGGVLESDKGMNIRNCSLRVPSCTKKDREDLTWIFEKEKEIRETDNDFVAVDYVALSFVREADDITMLRGALNAERKWDMPIIAKMETADSFKNRLHIFEKLSNGKGGVMVARGDLAVETSHEAVPGMQKQIIEETSRIGIPVIVATEMLDSMRNSSTPLRAEVVDVANAVREGADMVMLSAETAVGNYPVETTLTMARILRETEGIEARKTSPEEIVNSFRKVQLSEFNMSTTEAIAWPACEMARLLESPAIVVCASTGLTTRKCASYRPSQPVIVVTLKPSIATNLLLHRGVYPVLIEHEPQNADELARMIDKILEELSMEKLVTHKGKDLVVSTLAAGERPLSATGQLKTNLMYVTHIKRPDRPKSWTAKVARDTVSNRSKARPATNVASVIRTNATPAKTIRKDS